MEGQEGFYFKYGGMIALRCGSLRSKCAPRCGEGGSRLGPSTRSGPVTSTPAMSQMGVWSLQPGSGGREGSVGQR